jgi:hypothetical protein
MLVEQGGDVKIARSELAGKRAFQTGRVQRKKLGFRKSTNTSECFGLLVGLVAHDASASRQNLTTESPRYSGGFL